MPTKVCITCNREFHYIGSFDSEAEAAEAYNEAALASFGEYAFTNKL